MTLSDAYIIRTEWTEWTEMTHLILISYKDRMDIKDDAKAVTWSSILQGL